MSIELHGLIYVAFFSALISTPPFFEWFYKGFFDFIFQSFFSCLKFMIVLISKSSLSVPAFVFLDFIMGLFPGMLTAFFYSLTSFFPWGWKLYFLTLVFLICATFFSFQISTDSWLFAHICEWKGMSVSVSAGLAFLRCQSLLSLYTSQCDYNPTSRG